MFLAACATAASAPVVYGPSNQTTSQYPTRSTTTTVPATRTTVRTVPAVSTSTVVQSGPQQGAFQPNAELRFCGAGFGSNIPAADEEKFLRIFKPIIVVNGVVMATIPANDVCLSSGFGPRNGRPHKGIDVTSRPAGKIYSAAPGLILEAGFSRSFGNQIVMAHGNGVFSRYAHLEYIAANLTPGTEIGFGVELGLMGKTGNTSGVHLHFEILTGDYNTPKKSFGLQARDPFSFPAWSP